MPTNPKYVNSLHSRLCKAGILSEPEWPTSSFKYEPLLLQAPVPTDHNNLTDFNEDLNAWLTVSAEWDTEQNELALKAQDNLVKETKIFRDNLESIVKDIHNSFTS